MAEKESTSNGRGKWLHHWATLTAQSPQQAARETLAEGLKEVMEPSGVESQFEAYPPPQPPAGSLLTMQTP